MSRTHLCVLGPTGFTGKRVAYELASQISTLHAENKGFTWSIAGRRASALEEVFAQIKKIVGAADGKDSDNTEKGLLPRIISGVDVTDVGSLVKMASQTTLVLNCVGPFAELGENVVKAVLDASEATGQVTHYADVTGETYFIERMVRLYRDRAAKLGCTIIHAAGVDSIPTDIGVLYAKMQLGADVVPAGIEMGFTLQSEGRMTFNFATYASAVAGFASRKELSANRKQLFSALPRAMPLAVEKGLSTGAVKPKKSLGGLVQYHDGFHSHVMPFFFTDPAVVRMSQSLMLEAKVKDFQPISFVGYFTLPSLLAQLVVIVFLTLFAGLCDFAFGRALLLRYPSFFSGGLFSKQGPTQEQIDQTSFTVTLIARGHSKALLAGAAPGSKIGPDVTATIKVRGPEPGYVATPIVFVAAARSILKNGEAVNRGVLTPAAALHFTDIIKVLNEDGRVTMKKVA